MDTLIYIYEGRRNFYLGQKCRIHTQACMEGCSIRGDGETLLTDAHMALFRCGRSGNKPLCEGSHSEVGFEAG